MLSPHHSERERTIAVALHGIEPASFERCALIRDWLDDHVIERATLLVIPARDLHPVGERSPGMVAWLSERRSTGDAIAQHGFQHERLSRSAAPGRLLAHARGLRAGEFLGLDVEETRRAVHAGWRVLKLAGIEPDGFVAPRYAYTPALHATLATRFRWWAGLLRLHRAPVDPSAAGGRGRARRGGLAPAWSLSGGGSISGVLAPALLHVGALLPGDALRLDLHPGDLEHPHRMMALERLLQRCAPSRSAVTYEELAAREPTAGRAAPAPGGLQPGV